MPKAEEAPYFWKAPRLCHSCGFSVGKYSAEIKVGDRVYWVCSECFKDALRHWISGNILGWLKYDGWEETRERQARLDLRELCESLSEIV